MAKKKEGKKKARNLYTYYQIKGESVERKNKFCVKCGPGHFLAQHKDRLTCGKCGYGEFTIKS